MRYGEGDSVAQSMPPKVGSNPPVLHTGGSFLPLDFLSHFPDSVGCDERPREVTMELIDRDTLFNLTGADLPPVEPLYGVTA